MKYKIKATDGQVFAEIITTAENDDQALDMVVEAIKENQPLIGVCAETEENATIILPGFYQNRIIEITDVKEEPKGE